MRRLIEPPTASPTPEHAEGIRLVHDLAAEFAHLPPDRRRAYLDGTVRTQTTGGDRFRAIVYCLGGPLRQRLHAMLDALVASEVAITGSVYDTKHGLFTDADLREAGAMTTRTEIVFPIRSPWAVKPVVENGVVQRPGRRGDPAYRTPGERATGPEHTQFSVSPPLRTAEQQDDPWRAR